MLEQIHFLIHAFFTVILPKFKKHCMVSNGSVVTKNFEIVVAKCIHSKAVRVCLAWHSLVSLYLYYSHTWQHTAMFRFSLWKDIFRDLAPTLSGNKTPVINLQSFLATHRSGIHFCTK